MAMKRLLIGITALAALFLCAVAVLRRNADPDEGVVSAQPLETMTRDELYELARELEVPGRSNMKKAELRAAVSRAGRSG
jgi:hypothetical protein